MHAPARPAQAPIPRTIWALWLQGWDDAPEIVRACRRTWEALNPGWAFRPLTRESLPALLDERTMAVLTATPPPAPQTVGDIVRLELLERYGGVWADATTYCLQPLDTWLPEAAASGFFAFAKPGPDRMLSSWFLAAAPGSVLIARWAARLRAHYRDYAGRVHYFWLQHTFAACYDYDFAFRAVWDATPKILADGPHYYAPYHDEFWAPVSERDRRLLDEPFTPVLKLTHKLPSHEYPAGSTIRHLCDRAFARGAHTASGSPASASLNGFQ